MANLQKYKSSQLRALLGHYERKKDDFGEYYKHGNQNIDPSKSNLNYNLHDRGDDLSDLKFIYKRIGEVEAVKRKNINLMCTWVVTLPESLKNEPEEVQREFFQEVYKFNAKRYGEKNTISAYVHMDEVTPHMHFAFVPITWDKQKRLYKLSAKDVINRTELQRYHKELSKELNKHFKRDIGILVNDGNKDSKQPNKAIAELKQENQALLRQNQTLQNDKNKLESSFNELEELYKKTKEETDKLNTMYAYYNKSITELKDKMNQAKQNYKNLLNNSIQQDYKAFIESSEKLESAFSKWIEREKNASNRDVNKLYRDYDDYGR